jgi:hypothetical protein
MNPGNLYDYPQKLEQVGCYCLAWRSGCLRSVLCLFLVKQSNPYESNSRKMSLNIVFDEIMQSIRKKMQTIDVDSCEISIQEALNMVKFIEPLLLKLRTAFLEEEKIDMQSEIRFFKEMKPEVLNRLIYFNEVYTIGLKRPNGSNEVQCVYFV